jgi:hypothetical protein
MRGLLRKKAAQRVEQEIPNLRRTAIQRLPTIALITEIAGIVGATMVEIEAASAIAATPAGITVIGKMEIAITAAIQEIEIAAQEVAPMNLGVNPAVSSDRNQEVTRVVIPEIITAIISGMGKGRSALGMTDPITEQIIGKIAETPEMRIEDKIPVTGKATGKIGRWTRQNLWSSSCQHS